MTLLFDLVRSRLSYNIYNIAIALLKKEVQNRKFCKKHYVHFSRGQSSAVESDELKDPAWRGGED